MVTTITTLAQTEHDQLHKGGMYSEAVVLDCTGISNKVVFMLCDTSPAPKTPEFVIRRPPYLCRQRRQGTRKSATPSLRCSSTVHPGVCDALICPHEISSLPVSPLEGLNRRRLSMWLTSAHTIGCCEAHTQAVTFRSPRPRRDGQNTHTRSQCCRLEVFSRVGALEGCVWRNQRRVEFIYSVRRSSYSHMDRPTVISLDCTAPNKSAPALTGLFLTCSETMM